MIVVANLRLSGFFALVSGWVVEHAHRPLLLLCGIVAVSGVFSAFFVNDTMCLVLTPLVLEITAAPAAQSGSLSAGRGHGIEHRQRRHHHRQSAEHDDRQLLAAFPIATFAAALAPVAAVGLVLTVRSSRWSIAASFAHAERAHGAHIAPVRVHRALLWKSLAVSAGMIVFFFAAGRCRKWRWWRARCC